MNTLPRSSWAPATTPVRRDELSPARPLSTRRLCVPHLFQSAAALEPGAIGLISPGGAQLTYAELDRASNRLAGYLQSLGVGPEVAVAISLDRSFDFVIAALAVWKAGGAYLPLDSAWPVDRRQSIIDDAQAQVLITTSDLACRARYIVDIDLDAPAISREPSSLEAYPVKRDHLAYIVYTSGSTGQPKGVEVTHGNLLNLVFWHRRAFAVTPADRASHLSGLGFDAAVWELWPYLTAGATIVIPHESVRTSPELLRDWLTRQSITIAFVPTALAEPLIASHWPRSTALRFLLTGADTLHRYPSAGLPFELINNYGPTECTVVATSGAIPPDPQPALPHIGEPIANTRIHILDPDQRPVPQGGVGEIYIAGCSVGRGYRNQPTLTAQRFLEDPFAVASAARMYRTGDLARLLPDGRIAFCGRADDQEKIRGHRVEPDEIVRVLDRHPGVVASAVVARGERSDKKLIAYVIPAAGPELTGTALRDFLSRQLPDYMIPSAFVRMSEFPLNSSGKIDRAALPEPARNNVFPGSDFREPSSSIEKQVAAMLSELLHVDRVGLDDNFFLMGGHSLLGAQLVLRIRERFGVELTLRDIFESQTTATLSAEIERRILSKLESMTEEEAARLLALESDEAV